MYEEHAKENDDDMPSCSGDRRAKVTVAAEAATSVAKTPFRRLGGSDSGE